MDSVGDLARALVLRTNQVRLRNDMDKLAVEVATGLAQDPAKRLAGDVSSLTAIDRSLARLDAFRVNTAEAAMISGAMQQSLEIVQDRSATLAGSLLSAELTPTSAMTRTLSENAAGTLGQTIANLNQSVAGRFLFAGTRTDQAPLADANDLIDAARTAVTGATTLADFEAALDTFFGAGDVFEMSIYQGSPDGLAAIPLGEGDAANIDFRASDQEVRDILKPMVMAALAADEGLGLDVNLQVDILRAAGVASMAAQEDFTNMRARLGASEGRIEDATARNAAERSAAEMAKLDLVGADAYESASRYEDVRLQLESLYAITARSQRLTLTNFL